MGCEFKARKLNHESAITQWNLEKILTEPYQTVQNARAIQSRLGTQGREVARKSEGNETSVENICAFMFRQA